MHPWLPSTETPGCEARPSPDSDDTCGDPATVVVLCTAAHEDWCSRRPEARFNLWLCDYHLQCLRKGYIGCVPCGGTVVIILMH